MNPSLFTVDPHTLDNYDLKQLLSLQQWQHQVSKLFDQILRAVPLMPSPPNSAVYMDGTGNWSTPPTGTGGGGDMRSEEHTSELQSRENLVCRLLLEKKKKNINSPKIMKKKKKKYNKKKK